jgi:LEA14-like dessication related protein
MSQARITRLEDALRDCAGSGLLAILFLSAACSVLGINFREPDIQLDHVVVRGLGVSGGNLDLVLQVENPNNFSLQGTKLEVGLEVDDSHLGDVTYDDNFAIPEKGGTTLTLPLRFGWAGVGSAVRAALAYGDLPYKMKGQATLSLPGGLSKVVSFTHEGRAPLTRAGENAVVPGGLTMTRMVSLSSH